jgi:hypothetical protein
VVALHRLHSQAVRAVGHGDGGDAEPVDGSGVPEVATQAQRSLLGQGEAGDHLEIRLRHLAHSFFIGGVLSAATLAQQPGRAEALLTTGVQLGGDSHVLLDNVGGTLHVSSLDGVDDRRVPVTGHDAG